MPFFGSDLLLIR